MRTLESKRESVRRSAPAVIARAAGLGLVVGGVLGAMVVLTTAAYDRDLDGTGVPVLFASIVGGVVGVMTAVPASLVWMFLVGRTSATPTTARWVAAGAAAAIVLGIYSAFTQSLDWPAAAWAIGAGLTAFVTGPWVGYQRSTTGADRITQLT